MSTYHGFHLVYIDAGEFFSVDIEVHIEMAGIVFLDNLEVPFRGGGFCEDFLEGFFSRDDVLARDIVGVDSLGPLRCFTASRSVWKALMPCICGYRRVIYTNGCPSCSVSGSR